MHSAWLAAMVLLLACGRAPGVPTPDGGERGAPLADTYDLDQAPDYDPWRPFNEKMFTFNHDVLDRWLLKPAATGWDKAIPRLARRGLAHALDNLDMPRRLVNNALQLRPVGAGREIGRFVLNSTVGVAGLVDVASLVHLGGSDADTGETLALYGVGAGPYVVLPTMPPLTLRDAVGRTADGFLDPVGFFLPFVANRVKSIVTTVNERSLDLRLFADVEDSVLDLYSAARNAYLQRRRAAVLRAAADRDAQWQWAFGPAKAEPAVAVAATEPLGTQ
jgi:phospholipid-binding lipoprotein MlaA